MQALRSQADAWVIASENEGLAWEYTRRMKRTRPQVVQAAGGPDEIYQQAMLGLFQAALVWDEEKGKYSTIAFSYMKAEVLGYTNGGGADLIRVPDHIRGERRVEEKEKLRYVSVQCKILDDERAANEPAVPEPDPDEISEEEINLLRSVMTQLDSRSRRAVELRYNEGLTLDQIGQAFEVSRERARQICDSALGKLRGYLSGIV